jgi:hypothetical protein
LIEAPQRLEHWPIGEQRAWHQIERPETTVVIERQHPARSGFDDKMIMFANLIRINPPAARHAEVEDQRIAAISFNQPVFRPARKPRHPRTGQPLAQINRDRPPQVSTARLHPREYLPLKHSRNPAHGGFNFGKLWHRKSASGRAAAWLEGR